MDTRVFEDPIAKEFSSLPHGIGNFLLQLARSLGSMEKRLPVIISGVYIGGRTGEWRENAYGFHWWLPM